MSIIEIIRTHLDKIELIVGVFIDLKKVFETAD